MQQRRTWYNAGKGWVGHPLEMNDLLREIPITADGRGFGCGCRWDVRLGWMSCTRELHRMIASHDPSWEPVKRFLALRRTLRGVRGRLETAGFTTRLEIDVTGGLRMTVDGDKLPFLELVNVGSIDAPNVVLRAARRGGTPMSP